jgi:sialate O-acetylesterase
LFSSKFLVLNPLYSLFLCGKKIKKPMKQILLLALLLSNVATFAQLKLARLFSDHVVLQRQKPIPIWGWAAAKEKISITMAGQTLQTQADVSGKWQVSLQPLEVGGPHILSVKAKSGTLEVKDILIGEVWLCSGQSNMEWQVKSANNFKVEKQNANYPQIRHFFVEHDVQMLPQTDLKSGSWQVCSAETVGDFTAVGFFFARELYQKLNIPVGLLHSSWGGSQVEGWISKEAMLSSDELKGYAQTMPQNWEIADRQLERSLKQKTLGNANLSPTLDDEKKYLLANYDFAKWFTTDALGQWDWKGLWAFRGNGFMAKSIEIPADMVAQNTTLSLAENDNTMEVYLNGKLILSGAATGVRRVSLPPNSWQTGKNQLVIKLNKMLEPAWFGVGLKGSEADLFVASSDQKIPLADNNWKLMPSFAEKHEYYHSSNNVGTTIYNGMIAPLLPFAIRGALWYQGETNAGRAYQYRKTFPLMITDWRNKWADEFPFYFVQLSDYGSNQNSNQGSNWAELREAQTMTLSLPKTGMAVTTDIGNPADIHPTNKQDVGHRLAINALKLTYNQDVMHSSPMYQSVVFENDKAVLSFNFVGNGLVVKDKYGYAKGFEIAGEDKIFYYAQASVQGDKIIVQHPKVQKPVAVRFAWSDSPNDVNIFNSEGLPLCPFRTDSWTGITVKNKFE